MANEMIRGIPFEYEPKRVNRFFAEFADELGIEVWKVQKFKRPSMKINSVPIQFMNEQNYVAGRYTWDEMALTFFDPIGPSTSQQLMEWVRLHAESLTGRMGYAAGYNNNSSNNSTLALHLKYVIINILQENIQKPLSCGFFYI